MLAASWSGALPIIPFAGLEFLMLFLCMHYVSRATCRREVITIHRDRITVERGISGPEQCYSLSRRAAYLHVISPSKPFDLHQLFLVGDESRVPIAALLNDEDREAPPSRTARGRFDGNLQSLVARRNRSQRRGLSLLRPECVIITRK